MSQSIPELLLGTSNIGPPLPTTPGHTHTEPEKISSLLATWEKLGGTRLDTASVYGQTEELGSGGSERALRDAGATSGKFVIDTKVQSFVDGAHGEGKIRESFEKSSKDLNVDKVNILYLHSPDRATPVLTVLKQLDELYKEGKYSELGLSNYREDEVEEFVKVAREHSFIAPTVYQGNYSALARRGEEKLFPTLRKYGIAFYAYSPLAMGMLAGGEDKESIENARRLPPGSRFHPDSRKAQVFQGIWFKPGVFEGVKLLNKGSKDSGITPTELSLRWIAHHSQLSPKYKDALVLGASNDEQLIETTNLLRKGPLDDKLVKLFEDIWEVAKDDAPKYSN